MCVLSVDKEVHGQPQVLVLDILLYNVFLGMELDTYMYFVTLQCSKLEKNSGCPYGERRTT